MISAPLLNPRGRLLLGNPSIAATFPFVCSREFIGPARNAWSFPLNLNLVFTDARTSELVTLLDEQ